ncbi:MULTISPECIES: energy-coupling factor ABC transporter substrate-binding protein [Arthrospira]|jgi:cobalt/nickel transport protein|uniref:Cobalt transport protein CbiN n=1 Tax=Limnospira platensis NIES-46 TaxID=1236695 RepID=A0A5M3T719_LIMPL|nr:MULTISPECIES: energy-coupling factor ABC transporter substrate-binding protein [Arthrospira]AMW30350.1 cobalt transporter [Arthrospira platensis YZ]KDR55937.1 cobalt transporter [Arthrospira platensis str. Paraca]MBD2668076.1 energy-coupling factor ABC transporter substrate-binding protein [Arthrospira platensis FACHB-439]MBD2709213.1 energy-coupling factor ABC transporter substrate-binding protein [Arthrospira platensis FACHB-835]MDF2207717.1 energy-coupling factor ABC transporter substrat
MTPTSDQPVKNRNLWMILAVVILSITPLIFIRGDYEGADEQAENLIGEIQPNYQPWFEPILEVPSGEIESLLFVSQAAIGAGIVGYVIGLYKGRQQGKNRSS